MRFQAVITNNFAFVTLPPTCLFVSILKKLGMNEKNRICVLVGEECVDGMGTMAEIFIPNVKGWFLIQIGKNG
jgi:hypothetical protein